MSSRQTPITGTCPSNTSSSLFSATVGVPAVNKFYLNIFNVQAAVVDKSNSLVADSRVLASALTLGEVATGLESKLGLIAHWATALLLLLSCNLQAT